jgi:L-alanine-DL-glutamate epimerase-like enolase superfamily enzyme
MAISRKRFLQTVGLGGLGFLGGGAAPAAAGLASAQTAARAQARKVKITGVEIYYFTIPLKDPFRISIGTVYAANDVLVRVLTDAGVVGVGEACPFPPITGETQETNIIAAKSFRDMVLGKNPLAIEERLRDFGSFVHTNPGAAAAYDMAFYDILGKLAGLPVFRLLGGDEYAIETDLTCDLEAPEVMARAAKSYVDRGFMTVKVKVGQGPEIDTARLRAIRESIGPLPRLRIDANQGWTVPRAIDSLRRLEKYDIEFCEQPVPADDISGLRAVRMASPIPIMADEALFLPPDAVKLIRAECCDYFNIKIIKAGGIHNSMKIAHIAQAADIRCMVGCMLETRLALTAAAHVAAALPQTIIFADLDGMNSHTIDPIVDGMAVKAGRITLPELPGLGADVDPAFLKTLKKI